MPSPRRRQLRPRLQYTEEHKEALLTGSDWFHLFATEEDRRQGWEDFRDELLPAWIAEHPGTRPAVWWEFDAPERRRITDGKPHPFDNPERESLVAKWRAQYPAVADSEAHKLYYGMPGSLMVRDDFEATYETEAEYLARLGLLEECEKQTRGSAR